MKLQAKEIKMKALIFAVVMSVMLAGCKPEEVKPPVQAAVEDAAPLKAALAESAEKIKTLEAANAKVKGLESDLARAKERGVQLEDRLDKQMAQSQEAATAAAVAIKELQDQVVEAKSAATKAEAKTESQIAKLNLQLEMNRREKTADAATIRTMTERIRKLEAEAGKKDRPRGAVSGNRM